MCNLKTVGTLCKSEIKRECSNLQISQVYCGRKTQSACDPMRPPSSRRVIHINYVFHNVVNLSRPQLSLWRKNNNLFYSQSWCHHLLLRNMSTCGMFQTAVFLHSQSFVAHAVPTCLKYVWNVQNQHIWSKINETDEANIKYIVFAQFPA